MKKILLSLILVSSLLVGAIAQTGALRGRVLDGSTNETIPGANVYVMIGNKPFATTTDANGYYYLRSLNPGIYTLYISYTGFNKYEVKDVPVNINKITGIDDAALTKGVDLKIKVDVYGYRDKLIDIEDVTIIRSKEFEKLAEKRSIPDVIRAITPGAYVSEDGKEVIFRGSRNGGVIYIVDGMKQRGSKAGVPSTAIASMMVYMGGVPAKYGDFDGGVVVIETKSYFDIEAGRN
jgi:hypothetical protein